MKSFNNTEKVVMRGQSSPLAYGDQYLYGLLLALAFAFLDKRISLIPIAICTWIWLSARAEHYVLTNTRVIIHSGVLNKQSSEVMLADIVDIAVPHSRFASFMRLSTVIFVVDASADFHPCVKGIPNANLLIRKIQRIAQDNGW